MIWLSYGVISEIPVLNPPSKSLDQETLPSPCCNEASRSSLVVTSRITTWGGYMVCTLVCRVHLMRDHRTRTGTVTYSNAA